MASFFNEPNTYPKDWTPRQRQFFDEEPNNYRGLYSADEWPELQDGFQKGWLDTGISKEEHELGRRKWFETSGVTEDSFDWEAYRGYLRDIGSPSLAA